MHLSPSCFVLTFLPAEVGSARELWLLLRNGLRCIRVEGREGRKEERRVSVTRLYYYSTTPSSRTFLSPNMSLSFKRQLWYYLANLREAPYS